VTIGRRFIALSLVTACGMSLTASGAGAVEASPRDVESVVASVTVAPSVVETESPDANAVVDITMTPSDASPGQAPGAPEPPDAGGPSDTSATVAQAPRGMSDFGTPPSGIVPILFNDHHVYAKPDELRRGRLLAALVKNGAIMIPIRSLFEQLGATVSYDPATRAIVIRKPGTDVSLTVGKPVIVIDGETRPLDVPPAIENGIVLVPVRVCSEVFGAYVQYIPQLRAVSIRYLGPTATISAPATPVPLRVETPPPTPGPRRIVPRGPDVPKLPPGLETLVVVDTAVSPHVNDEFAPNVIGPVGQNYQIRGATEFDLLGGGFELDGSFRQYRYAHPDTGVPVALIGGLEGYIPAFVATEHQFDIHAGIRLSPEKYYLVFGYASQSTSYGYPTITGLGLGLTKLPALDRRLSFEGSIVYYPNMSGTCKNSTTCPGSQKVAYSSYRYFGGLTFVLLPHIFLEGGFEGDRVDRKAGFPTDGTYAGPFAGLGARF
jgi:hypothetical protein